MIQSWAALSDPKSPIFGLSGLYAPSAVFTLFGP